MSVEVQTSRFVDSFQQLEAAILQATALAIRAAVTATADAAKATRLGKHRKMAVPIEAHYQGIAGGRVVAHGIQPYTITAKNARVLRFEVAGQVLYRRMVRNPGTRPEKYMQGPIEVAQQTVAYGMEYYLSEAIRRSR
jgi:hypothetical protein